MGARGSIDGSLEDAAPLADDTPKVLLCGPHRGGKTSIVKVVFAKMSPHETLFFETTPKVDVTPVARNALVRFKVLDFPGFTTFDESSDHIVLFNKTGAVVFVIDAQEEPYADALKRAS